MSNVRRAPSPKRATCPKPAPVVLVGFSGFAGEGLQRILAGASYKVVAGAPCLSELTPAQAGKGRLIIINAPEYEPDLADAVGLLRADDPDLRIVLMVDTDALNAVDAALRVPAHAFLCHTVGCEQLLKALDVVRSGAVVLSNDLLAGLLSRAPAAEAKQAPEAASRPLAGTTRPLSEREHEVLRCLADGASNKLIARRFDIAESTVKIHVKGILRKINVLNRTQAAMWALAHLPPAEVIAAAAGASAMSA